MQSDTSNTKAVRAFLEAIEEPCEVLMITSTEPSWARKTGNPYWGKVRQLSLIEGVVGSTYGRAVNDERHEQGLRRDFEPSKRLYGERVGSSSVLVHERAEYVQVVDRKVLAVEYHDQAGRILDPELVRPWLRLRVTKPNPQGLERAVEVRCYDISNVVDLELKSPLAGILARLNALPPGGVHFATP